MGTFAFFSSDPSYFRTVALLGECYWPLGLARNKARTDERVGDDVFIIAGKKLHNGLKAKHESHLKRKIIDDDSRKAPIIVYHGKIDAIHQKPLIYYLYTDHNGLDYKVPVEAIPRFLEKALDFPALLDAERAGMSQVYEVYSSLERESGLSFTDAYRYDDKDYRKQNERNGALKAHSDFLIVSGENTYYCLDSDLSTYEPEQDLKFHKNKEIFLFLSRESLNRISELCGESGKDIVKRLGAFKGVEYSHARLSHEPSIHIPFQEKLYQGTSTVGLDDINEGSPELDIAIQGLVRNYLQTFKGDDKMRHAKNTILFGPPATGKTYLVMEKALAIVAPNAYQELLDRQAPRGEMTALYREYVKKQRIVFCTFHQSYSYEEFVEGLKSDGNGNFVPESGIFKSICKNADRTKKLDVSSLAIPNLFKISLGRKGEDLNTYCLDNDLITLGHGDDVDFTGCDDKDMVSKKVSSKYRGHGNNETVIQQVHSFKNQLSIGDFVVASYGNMKISAVGRVVGDYFYDNSREVPYSQFRKVEWLIRYDGDEKREASQLVTGRFMQKAIYKIKLTDIVMSNLRSLLEEIDSDDNDNPDEETENYVLIIDEINRGNISRIFGELITLIEDDKRKGEVNEISATLAYSKEPFQVPSNVHIIGTMNTADRSISLMDTALRRRFDFIEMKPDETVLSEDVEGIDLRKLLVVMNRRIEYLYNKDHLLGHGLFITDSSSKEKIMHVMTSKVIPLLQEYFYEDYEKICLVLGGASENKDEKNRFLYKEKIDAATLFNGGHGSEERRKIQYRLVDDPELEAILNIYEGYTES
ncbi:AAA family ATPase [Exiguobacterium profundum]|uniref:AAA family ATPase n=1 Tax=Exiguobacterium profundum TaxID=307643 RepID=UPI003393109F